jgi:alpha-1,4-digalacturonate transport system permease protein
MSAPSSGVVRGPETEVRPSGPRSAGGGGTRPRRACGTRLAPYLFLAPNMVLFLLFTIGPAFYSFYLSAFSTSPFRATRFVGLGNYAELLDDGAFRNAVGNSVVFVVSHTTIVTLVAIAVAVLLNTRIRARGFFRSVYFFPVLLSPVVVALVWRWILDTDVGLLNAALQAVGLEPQPWLLDGNLAMMVVIAVGVWIHTGFYAMILLAGLQSIDQSLYEAALVDGASPWQKFLRVTLPLLRPTILVVLILSVIAGFQAFDYIFVLTGGGPTFSTALWVQYIYRTGFDDFRFGLAAAASVLLFLVVFALTMLQFVYARRSEAA